MSICQQLKAARRMCLAAIYTKRHSEPFAALKDKLREESLILANQTLRFAQGNSFEVVT